MPTTVEALLLAFALTPGFLLSDTVKRINPTLISARDSLSRLVISIVGSAITYVTSLTFLAISNLVLSTLNYPEWQPSVLNLTWWTEEDAQFLDALGTLTFEFIAFGLAAPIIIGWVVGRLSLSRKLDRILALLNSDRFSLTPTAWDHCVYHREHEVHVTIALMDGGEITGYLGSKSAVAASADGGDIYVERRKGELDDRSSEGIWIAGSAIKFIRFAGTLDVDELELGG